MYKDITAGSSILHSGTIQDLKLCHKVHTKVYKTEICLQVWTAWDIEK